MHECVCAVILTLHIWGGKKGEIPSFLFRAPTVILVPFFCTLSSSKTFHNQHTGTSWAIPFSRIVYTSPEEHHLAMVGINCSHPGQDGETNGKFQRQMWNTPTVVQALPHLIHCPFTEPELLTLHKQQGKCLLHENHEDLWTIKLIVSLMLLFT